MKIFICKFAFYLAGIYYIQLSLLNVLIEHTEYSFYRMLTNLERKRIVIYS